MVSSYPPDALVHARSCPRVATTRPPAARFAAGRRQGLEGTREFLRNAGRATHPGRWISSVVVAEGDMVVQFGPRELHWPGGASMVLAVPQGIATRDTAFADRLAGGRIAERWAIRDDLSMLRQLGALDR